MINDLILKMQPTYENDIPEFEDIKNEIEKNNFSIIWDASSGLDLCPLILSSMKKIKNPLDSIFSNSIFIMSDYGKHISTLKDVYEKLDNGAVKLLWKSKWFFEGLTSFKCNCNISPSINDEIFIDQMIPFKCNASVTGGKTLNQNPNIA